MSHYQYHLPGNEHSMKKRYYKGSLSDHVRHNGGCITLVQGDIDTAWIWGLTLENQTVNRLGCQSISSGGTEHARGRGH